MIPTTNKTGKEQSISGSDDANSGQNLLASQCCQEHQRQVQSSTAGSIYVLPLIHQPQRDLSGDLSRKLSACTSPQNLTQEKCAHGAPNKSSKLECNKTLVTSKDLSNLKKNQTHMLNTLQDNALTQFPFKMPNMKASPTTSSVWQGTPISTVKTFATKNFTLCTKERAAILKRSGLGPNPQLLSYTNNEICGSCRHRPQFHMQTKQIDPSANESINDERAIPADKVTKDIDRYNSCLADA